MNRKIEIKCSNCGALNTFRESELVSGVPKKNINGQIVQEYPPVTVDENTLVGCEKCKYPMSCKNVRVYN